RDDSSATIGSAFSGISKKVLPRTSVVAGTPASAATSCDVAPGAPWADDLPGAGDDGFHLGDLVCYELTVDFADGIDVRGPLVTDVLPKGVVFVDSAVYEGTGGTTAGVVVPAPTVEGSFVRWPVGELGGDGKRFVPGGARLVLHVLGTVTSLTPNSAAAVDKPENLMKYR